MPNLQYIGARYVPKFYENPDDGSNNWKAGVPYEPLTVVTDSGDSYTSKIPVPGSVGAPSLNPTYWVKTGAYNASVTALQNAVGAIQNTIADYDKKLEYQIGNITFNRYHFTNYCIDIIKIPYLNRDGSKNIPVVKAQYNAQPITDFDENSIASTNCCFTDTATFTKLIHDVLTEGSVINGDTATTQERTYLTINDDGVFGTVPYGTDLNTLPALGIHNAAQGWDLIGDNGVYVTPLFTSPNIFSHLIAQDYDNNYYIISASDALPYTFDSLAMFNFIKSEVPTVRFVFALDHGRSLATNVARVRTNLETDMRYPNGRPLAGAIVFPNNNPSNDINSIGNLLRIVENNNQPKSWHYTPADSAVVQIGTHWQVMRLVIQTIGNICIASGILKMLSPETYSDAWETVTIPDLPIPDHKFYAYAIPVRGDQGHVPIRFQFNEAHQSGDNIAADVAIRARGSYVLNGDYNWDFRIVYTIRQNS